VVATQDETTGIFNIGRGERNSINYLAEIILNIMDKDLQPVYESPLPGDVEHSLADISKAEKMGYRPEYDLGTGLKQTIASVQSL
jgi:UDP-glucose 4-epimerase